jgi:hypothetical protein
MWESRRLTTLFASKACYRDSFNLPNRDLWVDCLENVGASTSHIPKGHQSLLQGELYVFFYSIRYRNEVVSPSVTVEYSVTSRKLLQFIFTYFATHTQMGNSEILTQGIFFFRKLAYTKHVVP